MIKINSTIKNKFSIYKYIEFTSVLMVFMQGFVITGLTVIDLKLYYFFLITNSVLLSIYYELKIHKNLALLILLVVIHAFITNTLYSIPYIHFVKQVIGLSIAAIYFYNIFRLFDINNLFKIYLKLALIFCIVAIIFYPTGLLDKEVNRMDGLMSEPSKFIIVNVPAFFYFLKKKKYFATLILLLGFILAKSSLGYIAILLAFLFFFLRKKSLKYFGLVLFIAFISFSFLKENDLFQDRLSSSIENINIFQKKSFSNDVNVSTYALLKNAYISVNNFIDHPFGTGIGSHGFIHDTYLQELKIPKFISVIKLEGLNREDANSLLLRVISDFGIFGIFGIFIFVLLGVLTQLKDFESENKIICIGMLIYFIIKLLRMGHYFPEEMYFFMFMYLYTLPKFKLNHYTNQIL